MSRKTAPEAPKTAEPTIVEQVIESEEDQAERAATNLMELVNNRSAFDKLVADLKKGATADSQIAAFASIDFLPWKHGPYRLSIDDARILSWLDAVKGEQQRTPVLQVTVLDSATKEGKQLVGKSFMMACNYAFANPILQILKPDIANAGPKELLSLIESNRRLIPDYKLAMVASVTCDSNGSPIKKSISRARQVLAEVNVVVLK